MPKIDNKQKSVLFLTSIALFALGIFLWVMLPDQRSETGQAPAILSGTEDEKSLAGTRTDMESCPISQDQSQDDVLFIGCNGFF